jgi:F0F1-type ATP synthase membrane subunit c/vacuolar-type H+-ATPase subunit K
VKQPRFAPFLFLLALAGAAFATPDAGNYLVVSRDSEAIFDLFSMPVVGIAIFLGVVIFGMVVGLQRSAHAAHMEQMERQRQALRGRRPPTGAASRSPAGSPKQPAA